MKHIVTSVAVVAFLATTINATNYSESEAMNALYYCKAAYCDSSKLADWSCDTCVLHHTSFTSVSVQQGGSDGFLSYTGYNPNTNQIVIAFRGTDNIANWFKDLDFFFTDYSKCSGCKVHRGFYESWQSVSSGVITSINTLFSSYPSASVLVTGHSLGAAVSLFAALDLATQTSVTLRLYNFGEPRVGNPTFAAWAASVLPGGKQFRVTHKADPVPHVPPMSFGFLHCPHELWYNNNGDSSYSDCNDSPSAEDPNCSDSVTIPDVIHDHVMYLGKCTNCENQPDSNGHCPI